MIYYCALQAVRLVLAAVDEMGSSQKHTKNGLNKKQ